MQINQAQRIPSLGPLAGKLNQTSSRTNTLTSMRKLESVKEIDTDCKVRFKIDSSLAKFLSIDEWSTFKEVTIGLLRYNKVVGDFYDRTTSTFNAYKYPIFSRYFPDQSRISSEDLKKYLLQRQ